MGNLWERMHIKCVVSNIVSQFVIRTMIFSCDKLKRKLQMLVLICIHISSSTKCDKIVLSPALIFKFHMIDHYNLSYINVTLFNFELISFFSIKKFSYHLAWAVTWIFKEYAIKTLMILSLRPIITYQWTNWTLMMITIEVWLQNTLFHELTIQTACQARVSIFFIISVYASCSNSNWVIAEV